MGDAEESMSCDFIHLSLSQSQFAKVIFQDVKDVYNPNEDVECAFTVTGQSNVHDGDKVAIFPVGWNTTSGYLLAENVDPSEAHCSNLQQKVIFKCEQLPKDDSEFYQFCYLTGDDNISGASIPFVFKTPLDEELLSVEDAENDLLIIRTRSALREELVREMTKQQAHLQKENGTLADALRQEKERQDVLETEFKDKITALDELRDKVHSDLQESTVKLLQDELEVEGPFTVVNEAVLAAKRKQNLLETSVKNLKMEKELLEKRLSAVNCELETQLKKVEALTLEVNMHAKTIVEVKYLVNMLENSNSELLTKGNQFESTLMDKEATISDLKHTISVMEMGKKTATDEASRAKREAEERIADISANLDHCRNTCTLLVAEKTDLLKRLENIDSTKEDMRNTCECLANEAAKLKDEKEMLELSVMELKNRLAKGGEEYRKKYIEWYRAQKKCVKLQEKLNVKECVDTSNPGPVCESGPVFAVGSTPEAIVCNNATSPAMHSLDPQQKVKILAEMEKQLQGFQTSKPNEMAEETHCAVFQETGMMYPYPMYYPYPYPSVGNSFVKVDGPMPFQNSATFDHEQFVRLSGQYVHNFDVSHQSQTEERQSMGNEVFSSVSSIQFNQVGHTDVNQGGNQKNITCCPVCEIPFVTETDARELEAHIAEHFAFTCPMCGMQFEKHEGNANQMFESHVSSHFHNEGC